MTTFSRTASVVAILSLTQLLGWGATFWMIAVTGPSTADDLQLPLSIVMSGPTAMLMVMAIVSWPLGTAFERFGASPIMTIGAPLASVGLIIMGMAGGPIAYFLSWTMLGVAGSCMLSTPAQIAVTEIAGEKSRNALSVLILVGGLTSTIMWPVTDILQAHWGWRTTTLIYAALLLLVCMPLHWYGLARNVGNKTKGGKSVGSTSADLRRFILLAASFAANGFFTWGFALTIIILFEAKGLDHTSALAAAAFIGIAQWAGRMTDLAGGHRWSGLAMGLAGAALFPASFIVLLVTNSFGGAVVFAILYGIASGITAVARATLPLELFPPGAYARSSARMSVPLNFAFATAPPAFTAIMTLTSPQGTLWLALIVSIFAFATLVYLAVVHRRVTSAIAA
ncbi:MFS transporter [Neorhizobium sp. R1-B]|uniref:MFS transporter n=1 Tax=Neorhizobium sp. R1-B TaxID=2485162 RepID=UPI0010657A18|nr:MFS transporter [Neorhizobium sp. R1-B]